MDNKQYPEKQILAVLNNPNDYPPKVVAKMIEAGCFKIEQLTTITEGQKKKVNRALLVGKEDEYFNKCMMDDATVDDCQFFIANFSASYRRAEIENRKAEIELAQREREEEIRTEREAFDDLKSKIHGQSFGYDEKKNLISAFSVNYPFSRFAKELEDLKSEVETQEQERKIQEEERKKNQEAEDAWQMLLAQLASNRSITEKRQAIDAYERKYSLHSNEVPAKRQELTDQEDDSEWHRVLMILAQDISAEQKLAALNNYKLRYSKHANDIPDKVTEVERERNIMPEIKGVLGNSASTVNDFMALVAKYPTKKEFIREYMLGDMKVNPSRYSREGMYCLMNGKYDGEITYQALFSMRDLQNANVANYEILNHINTHPTDNDDRNQLENSLLPEDNFKSATNNTDVYFFGVPGSGKSTVLAGLFKLGTSGNLRLSLPAHGDHIGYTYASILQNYLEKNVFPQATKTRFVIRQDLVPVDNDEPNPFDNLNDTDGINADVQSDEDLIGTEVSDKFIQIIDGVLQENPGKENEEDHKISIIEMPGERTLDFAASSIRNPEEMDKLLGKGARELFMNGNRKLFFFVIDPKPQKSYKVNLNGVECPMTQAQALEAVVEFISSVPGLLEKIDSMHLILSKSDLLSNPNSIEVIQRDVIERGYEGLVNDIRGLCNPSRSNINVQCGHSPHLFTFSLGKVYPGHMIKYDKTDAEKILRVIAANTYSTRRNPTKLTSFIDWMNK